LPLYESRATYGGSALANAGPGALPPNFAWSRGVRRLLCLVVLQALSGPAWASLDPDKPIRQYIHAGWQTAQGLPQNSVLAIAQTPDGYLWLGTEEGVARFDGIRFTVFDKHTPGLKTNAVQVLLVDHNGNLWMGSSGAGLACYTKGKFTTYSSNNGLSHNSIRALYEDEQGALWIGTDGGGLIRFHKGKFRVLTTADGLADNAVFSISGDGRGTLWIGTHSGLSRLSGGKFSTFRARDGLDSDYIRAVHVTRGGAVWIGTGDGLCRLTAAGIRRFTTKDGLSNNAIYSLHEDRAGTLWIGTGGGGLNRLVNGTIDSYSEKDGLLGRDVFAILEDREGSLWIGTGGGGLNCFKRGSFSTLTMADGLTSNMILAAYQDAEGALWMGSNQGLIQMKDRHVHAYTMAEGLPDNLVFSVTQDRQGSMWIGTRRGLARLKNRKITASATEDGLARDFIMCTYTDREGNVWVGTRGILSRFNGKSFTTYTTKNGLPNSYVLSLYEDREGNLWIGTNGGGLVKFMDGRFSSYTTRQGLSNDVVTSIYGDDDGTLWLATNGGGLDRLRNGKITRYTSAQGLYDDGLLQILDDQLGHFWISSNKGVFKLDKKQLNDFAEGRLETITSTVFGTADGMKSRECNGGFQPAGWRAKDGHLYFPTTGGLAMIDPLHLVGSETPSEVVVERVLADNKEVAFDRPVVIPPGKGQLQFEFTAPSFVAPEKIQFRYMLEGFDKDWTQAGGRRVAYYTNIPHGEYRFRVRAGNDDKWSASSPVVSLTLQPFFYQTTTFMVLVVITGVSLCALAYRLRVNQLKMREQKLVLLVNERTSALQESERQLRHSRDELEIRVQERTSELVHSNEALEEEVAVRRRTEEQLTLAKDAAEAASRAKSDFLANMSHEIRTPINGILGMTDVTLNTDLNGEQREYLEIVKFSADSLLGIVNDILDFSKIEAQKLTLEKSPFELRKSIDELVRSLSLRARQKNLLLTCEVDHDVPNDVAGDPLRLRQVLLNLLDNAIKFTTCGGVSLSVSKQGTFGEKTAFHFAVTDTGIGISPDKQKTIFEAFSQADTSSTRRYGGTGLGLTISCQLAAMMEGNLWVESELGSGSTFHFIACFDVLPPARPVAAEPELRLPVSA
jgi:signal transduction histidine kinase/ligand-binding sensor domain-containing protein